MASGAAGFLVGLAAFAAFSRVEAPHGEVQGPVWEPTVSKVEVVTTGYSCPKGGYSGQCDKGEDDGRTATNKQVVRGMCAADWDVYRPGTRFVVPGYGTCVVEDRGRLIKGHHLDLYFDANDQARNWGRQKQLVYLIRG